MIKGTAAMTQPKRVSATAIMQAASTDLPKHWFAIMASARRTHNWAFPSNRRTLRPLAFNARDVNDPTVPTLFGLLVDLDAVDAAACIKFSQHAVAKGDGANHAWAHRW